MRGRERILRAAALLGLLVAGGSCGGPPPTRPNVIVYLTDTLRADHLGLYGYGRDTSPNLDDMAEDAVVFRQAFAPSSWTKSSTASLLSGLTPLQHDARGRDSRLPERVGLMSETMRELGYHTAAVITNPFVGEAFGFDRGYDEFRFLGRERAEILVRNVREVLDARPTDRPFFLYVHAIDPHGPYTPPKPWVTAFTDDPVFPAVPDHLEPGDPPAKIQNLIDLYDSEILAHDHFFGELLDDLDDRGLYDDCMFWFVSDHGDELLEHDRTGHGKQLFNEVVHIPMVLKLPRNRHAGRSVEVPVSLIDTFPTVLAALGLPARPELEGIDLLTLLDGDDALRPLYFDLDLFVEELYVSRGVLVGQYKLIEELFPEPRKLLFDLAHDPLERDNLFESEPEVAAELEATLKVHAAAGEEGLSLRVVGNDSPGGVFLRGRLTTEGRFEAVETLETEPDDRVTLAPDGKSVELVLRLEDFTSNIGGEVRRDIDSLTLRMDPPDAEVVVESLELRSGDAFPLYRGLERAEVPLPHGLRMSDPTLATPDLGLLFRDEKARKTDPPPGMYAVTLKELRAEDVDSLSPEVREQLRHLGYLGDDAE